MCPTCWTVNGFESYNFGSCTRVSASDYSLGEQETLRLHPAIAASSRQSTEDIEIDGKIVPKNVPYLVSLHFLSPLSVSSLLCTSFLSAAPLLPLSTMSALWVSRVSSVLPQSNMFTCIELIHRDPAHWERPLDFYPEHFTDEAVAGRHQFAYAPFTQGPRICIGMHFFWYVKHTPHSR